MTPNELSEYVGKVKEILADIPLDVGEPPDEWDAASDFWEAFGLLEISLKQLELLCKIDLDLKFLRPSERAAMMTHTADLMTFIDLYSEVNDPEKGEEEVYSVS